MSEEVVVEAAQRRVDVSLPVAIGAGILTLGVGAAVGYLLGRWHAGRPGPLSPEDQAEIDDIRDNIARDRARREIPHVDLSALKEKKAEEEASGVVIDEKVYKAKRSMSIVPHPVIEEEPEPITANHNTIRRNVFAAESPDPEDDWNYDKEVTSRNSMNPYVIHRDEFFEETDEFDFSQRQLTWYNGDGVLVDEDRTPVYNHREVVGELKFGHGSGDPNVVYIRNERLKAEYEVWLDSGRYDVEVQGVDMEDLTAGEGLRHAHAPRRFRTE